MSRLRPVMSNSDTRPWATVKSMARVVRLVAGALGLPALHLVRRRAQPPARQERGRQPGARDDACGEPLRRRHRPSRRRPQWRRLPRRGCGGPARARRPTGVKTSFTARSAPGWMHPLAVVAERERALRRRAEPGLVVEHGVRAVDRLEAERARGDAIRASAYSDGAGADRQHGHAERRGEVAGPEDERLERRAERAMRSTSTRPRAVSICTSSARPSEESTTVTRRLTRLREDDDIRATLQHRREIVRHHGVPTALIRTASVPQRACRVRGSRALPSLSAGATPSSRSTTTSSAASAAAFSTMRRLEPGTVRDVRRGRTPPEPNGFLAAGSRIADRAGVRSSA